MAFILDKERYVMHVLDFQKITEHSDRKELLFKTTAKIGNGKDERLLPIPEVVYQNKELEDESTHDHIDRAFNLLFEATQQKLSTKSN